MEWERQEKGTGLTPWRVLGSKFWNPSYFIRATEIHTSTFHRWHDPTHMLREHAGYRIENCFEGTRQGCPVGIWMYVSGVQGCDVTHAIVIQACCRGLFQGECKQWEEETAQAWALEPTKKTKESRWKTSIGWYLGNPREDSSKYWSEDMQKRSDPWLLAE